MLSPNKQQQSNVFLLDDVTFKTGHELSGLPAEIKNQIAWQTSELLKLYPKTMLQFTPAELLEYIDNDLASAVFIENESGIKLIGFAKIYLWPGQNELGQDVYEIGSWIVSPDFRNHGFGH